MTTQAASAYPFCEWIIAREYYDGPMSGVAMRAADRAMIFFRAVAWDCEQWNRVFATTRVGEDAVEHLRTMLTKIETPKEPFWLPGPATNMSDVLSAWNAIFTNAGESGCWSLVESHDLLSATDEVALPADLSTGVLQLVRQGSAKRIVHAPLLPLFLDQLRSADRVSPTPPL